MSNSTEYAFAVEAKQVFTQLEGVDWFHSRMFHGKCESYDDYALGEDLVHPLVLEKNIYNTAEIIQPSLNLVVSDMLKKRLEHIPNIAFNKVVFSKLFLLPYSRGDFSHWDHGEKVSEVEAWLDSFQHDPSLSISTGFYNEIVVANASDFIKDYSVNIVPFEMPIGVVNRKRKFMGSMASLCDFPIFWDDSLFIRGDIFERFIKSEIDETYFACCKILIPS